MIISYYYKLLNMITRKAYSKLLEWKQSKDRKPLLIRGARQVGKTTIVRQFSNEFNNYIELNLSDKFLFSFVTVISGNKIYLVYRSVNLIYLEDNCHSNENSDEPFLRSL